MACSSMYTSVSIHWKNGYNIESNCCFRVQLSLVLKTAMVRDQQDGSEKGTCCQAWCLELELRDPHGENWVSKSGLWPPHVHYGTPPTYTHMIKEQIVIIIKLSSKQQLKALRWQILRLASYWKEVTHDNTRSTMEGNLKIRVHQTL